MGKWSLAQPSTGPKGVGKNLKGEHSKGKSKGKEQQDDSLAIVPWETLEKETKGALAPRSPPQALQQAQQRVPQQQPAEEAARAWAIIQQMKGTGWSPQRSKTTGRLYWFHAMTGASCYETPPEVMIVMVEMWQQPAVPSAPSRQHQQQAVLVARETITEGGMASEMQALIRRWS